MVSHLETAFHCPQNVALTEYVRGFSEAKGCACFFFEVFKKLLESLVGNPI